MARHRRVVGARRPLAVLPIGVLVLALAAVLSATVRETSVLGADARAGVAASDEVPLRIVGQTGGAIWHGDFALDGMIVGLGPRLVSTRIDPESGFRRVASGGTMRGIVERVLVDGTRAYVGLMDWGVSVHDLEVDGAPRFRGSVSTTGELGPMAARHGWLYVASGIYGLTVVDARDPNAPRVVQDARAPSGQLELGNVRSVAWAGEHLVVACGGSVARPAPGVRVLDVSEAGAPREVADVTTPGEAYGLAVDGASAFVVHAGPEDSDRQALWSVDLSEPTAPEVLSEVLLTDLIWDVAVADTRLYLAADEFGVIVYDVHEPAVPRLVGLVNVGWAHRVRAEGDVLVVFTAGGPAHAIDMSAPREPKLIGMLDATGQAADVVGLASHAAVAEWSHWPGGALRWLDVARPDAPRLLSSSHVEQWQEAVAREGGHVFLGGYDEVLRVYLVPDEASTEDEVTVVGTLNAPLAIQDLATRGTHVIAALGRGGTGAMWIVDAADPGELREVSLVYVEGAAYGVAADGDHVFVAADASGLAIIDVSQPAEAAIVAQVADIGRARGVAVHGRHAFVATYDRGVSIVDVSRREAPTVVSRLSPDDGIGSARAVVTDGQAAYVAATETGIAVVDVRQPSAPRLLGTLDTPGVAWGVDMADDHLYVADEGGGLLVLERLPLPVRPTESPSRTPGAGTPGATATPDTTATRAATATRDTMPTPSPTSSKGLTTLWLPRVDAGGQPGGVGVGIGRVQRHHADQAGKGVDYGQEGRGGRSAVSDRLQPEGPAAGAADDDVGELRGAGAGRCAARGDRHGQSAAGPHSIPCRDAVLADLDPRHAALRAGRR